MKPIEKKIPNYLLRFVNKPRNADFVNFLVYFSETKIVLKGENSAQLNDLAKQAEQKGLPNYIVHDAGRTQVHVCNLF